MSETNVGDHGGDGYRVVIADLTKKLVGATAGLKEERGMRAELVRTLGATSLPEAVERARKLVTVEQEHAPLQQEVVKLRGLERLEPDQKDQIIATLRRELRTRDAQSAFAKAATKAGLKSELHDDIYKLLGVELPEEGDITEDLFAEALEKNKAARPWAYAEPTSPPAGQSGTTLRPVGQSGELAVGNGAVKGPPGPGTVRGATEVTKPVSVADAIRAKFEATGRTDPYRIA